ncbi:MAG: hypothetical protein QOI98_608 [Solirubrobacteraceae bacterium]|jgi:hypothetical protein|nr:hypothetical protein [Solirubrobacteraceae bacterium]
MVTPVVQEVSPERAAELMRELQSRLVAEAAGRETAAKTTEKSQDR